MKQEVYMDDHGNLAIFWALPYGGYAFELEGYSGAFEGIPEFTQFKHRLGEL
jgi:hypothetical protein